MVLLGIALYHEGDALVEIDPSPYQAQLIQFQGQYARDKALLENAHLDLERYQAAYPRNDIPKQTPDTQFATVHQYEGLVQLDLFQTTICETCLEVFITDEHTTG